ncbi:MAG: PilZ domain-containing protein [Pseudomonadota bacterium]
MALPAESAQENRRAHERRSIRLGVRYITHSDLETVGKLVNVSEGGLYMETKTDAKVGDEIIAYPEGLGRLVGRIVRKDENGVAIEFDMSAKQRRVLTKRIGSAITGTPYLRLFEKRGHRRMALGLEAVARVPSNDKEIDCTIVDISPSGAALQSEQRPPVGKEISLGSINGVVCRHMEDGFAVSFA